MPATTYTKFDDGTNPVVTITGPARGNVRNRDRRQALGETETGEVYVYSRPVKTEFFSITWEEIPYAEVEALHAFFDGSPVNAMEGTFTLKFYNWMPAGVFTASHPSPGAEFTYTDVRFAQTRLEFTEIGEGWFTGSVQFRRDIS